MNKILPRLQSGISISGMGESLRIGRINSIRKRGNEAMTTFLSSLLIALRALMVNKMRSPLTMLGIIIGVAAVIAMVAVGLGAQSRIQEHIASLGSTLW